MKIVCAWCGKVLKEDAKEQTSHAICPECYDREVRPFLEARQRPREGKAFKPPPREVDWGGFFHSYMVLSLVFWIVLFAALLTAEGLHQVTGGRTPSLIEWIVKRPLNPGGKAHLRRSPRRLRDSDFRPKPIDPNHATQNESTEEREGE